MSIVVQTRIHQQNTNTFCGAACAQMTLAALGMDCGSLVQQEFYDASHAEGDRWLARPDLLTQALNARWGNAKDLRFRLFRCADKAGMNGVIRRMFEQFGEHGAVAISLFEPSLHWVVVRGFETHPADPLGPTIGYHVRNPLPPIEGNQADWPHAEDDACCVEHGVCHYCHYMSVANWNRTVQPVNEAGPWLGQYLVICPDRFEPGLGDEEEVPPTLEREAEAAPSTGPILSTQEVAARVERMVADNPLVGVDCINVAIKNTRPGTPILVEGLTEDGSTNPAGAYYLVPFVMLEGESGGPGSVPMAMAVNAVTGEFEEVIAAPDGSIYDPDWISPAGIERRARSNNMDTVRSRAQPDSDFPYLAVWRPTEQTPTRFWPLFVEDRPAAGDAARDASAPAFMRIDGEVLTNLERMHP